MSITIEHLETLKYYPKEFNHDYVTKQYLKFVYNNVRMLQIKENPNLIHKCKERIKFYYSDNLQEKALRLMDDIEKDLTILVDPKRFEDVNWLFPSQLFKINQELNKEILKKVLNISDESIEKSDQFERTEKLYYEEEKINRIFDKILMPNQIIGQESLNKFINRAMHYLYEDEVMHDVTLIDDIIKETKDEEWLKLLKAIRLKEINSSVLYTNTKRMDRLREKSPLTDKNVPIDIEFSSKLITRITRLFKHK